jgi:hypothetical protein
MSELSFFFAIYGIIYSIIYDAVFPIKHYRKYSILKMKRLLVVWLLILKASFLSSHNLSAISRIASGSNGQNTKDY